jgi:hypothetical protein
MVTIIQQSVFATGSDVSSTSPDSITIGGGSIWVEYGNGGDSMGAGPTSTIVQYSMAGGIENTYSATGNAPAPAGLPDGLKYDPVTGTVWVLNNNDGNSTLQFITPGTPGNPGPISAPMTYGSGYVYGANGGRGFDDVVFDGNRVFLSETNPATGDPVIVQLLNGHAPFGPNFGTRRTLQTTPILSSSFPATNLVTGQTQQLTIIDPDSLKLLPNGDLLLTAEQDGEYIFVQNPGTNHQTESFVTLPAGDVPDDAIMPTSTSGTFYISNQGGNNIVSVQVTGLNTNDLYADITAGPNANELVQIDLTNGTVTSLGVTGLTSPHGLAFVPSPDPVVAGNPPTSSLGTNNALTTTGVQNPGLDHVGALFNQSIAAGFPEQSGGQITTNALSQITTNEQHFLAQPHHG